MLLRLHSLQRAVHDSFGGKNQRAVDDALAVKEALDASRDLDGLVLVSPYGAPRLGLLLAPGTAARRTPRDEVAAQLRSCLDETEEGGERPSLLHAAASAGRVAAAQLLAASSPNLALQQDEQGRTALHISAAAGLADAVPVVRAAGPWAATALDSSGRTPLMTAHEGRHAAAARALVEAATPGGDLHAGLHHLAVLAARIGRVGQLRALSWVAGCCAGVEGQEPPPGSAPAPQEPSAFLASVADERGCSLLHLAAERGQLEVAQELVAAAPQLAARPNHAGQTPLHALATAPHPSQPVLQLLAGLPGALAGVEAAGGTLMHTFAAEGLRQATSALAEAAPAAVAAAALAPDGLGQTPLALALGRGEWHVVCSLLGAVARAGVWERQHFEAALEAMRSAGPAPAEVREGQGGELARRAATLDSSDLLELLLAAGLADAARANEHGRTLLHAAATAGSAPAVRALLAAAPATAGVPDVRQQLPLHLAAAGRAADVVQLLLAAAPQAAMVPGEGRQLPLHVAAEYGSATVVQLLLAAAPATAGVSDERQQLPLHLAAERGAADVVQLLLAAAPQAALVPGMEQQLPLHLAARRGAADVVQLLLAAAPQAALVPGMEEQLPLHLAAERGAADVVQLLLAAAPQAALVPGMEQQLPLHLAAERGAADVVQLLLAAAPEAALAPGVRQQLPLHLAAERGAADVVQLLLAAAPQAALVRSLGRQLPLHLAARSGAADAVQLLLAAEPRAAAARDFEGRTPLGVALREYRSAAARPLLRAATTCEALAALSAGGPAVQHLCADAVAAHLPLTDAQWGLVPRPCRHLGRALPAALRHSPQQAQQLVLCLPAEDAARIRSAALALGRAQPPLPGPALSNILSRVLAD